MMVEFVKPRRGIPVGAIRDMPDGAANVLIRRHFCKEVEPQHPAVKRKPKRKKATQNGSDQRDSE